MDIPDPIETYFSSQNNKDELLEEYGPDLINNQLKINALRSLNYPKILDNICNINYLTKNNRRVLVIGERHAKGWFDGFNLLYYYYKQSSVFLDIFIESNLELKDIKYLSYRGEDINFDLEKIREYFYNEWLKQPLSSRIHRMDIRKGGFINALNEDKYKNYSGLDVLNYDNMKNMDNGGIILEIENFFNHEWVTNYDIIKQRKKLIDKSLENKIKEIWKYILDDTFYQVIDHVKKQSNNARSVFLALIIRIIADWYFLLRLFKKFDTSFQPKEALNSIVYVGDLHAEVYVKFLTSIGFKNEMIGNKIFNNPIYGKCKIELDNIIPPLFEKTNFLYEYDQRFLYHKNGREKDIIFENNCQSFIDVVHFTNSLRNLKIYSDINDEKQYKTMIKNQKCIVIFNINDTKNSLNSDQIFYYYLNQSPICLYIATDIDNDYLEKEYDSLIIGNEVSFTIDDKIFDYDKVVIMTNNYDEILKWIMVNGYKIINRRYDFIFNTL